MFIGLNWMILKVRLGRGKFIAGFQTNRIFLGCLTYLRRKEEDHEVACTWWRTLSCQCTAGNHFVLSLGNSSSYCGTHSPWGDQHREDTWGIRVAEMEPDEEVNWPRNPRLWLHRWWRPGWPWSADQNCPRRPPASRRSALPHPVSGFDRFQSR